MIRKILNIRIPSLLGIIVLLAGVGLTSFLVDRGVIFESRAAPEKNPSNIAITNVSPNSFTVMYTTDQPIAGSLTYGTEKNGTNVALDDRDKQNGRPAPSTVHHITVPNLSPDTTYFFSILSGDSVFLNDKEPYEVKTAPELEEESEDSSSIHGSVRFADDTDKEDLLVLITSDDLQQLSAVVASDGTYSIPTEGVRTADLSEFADLAADPSLNLVVLNHTQKSNVTVLASNTDPVPLITFGEQYNFTLDTNETEDPQAASDSAKASFPDASSDSDTAMIEISSPEEKETFTDQRPVFTGTAIPGETIDVTIHSETPVNATVTVASDGSWEFRPTTPLAPGEHTITIRTRDVTGTLREFTRSFTVFAQGSQFVEPSVSPTRTPTPTLSSASPTPTATPTSEPSPTTTVTEVTDTPTPTVTPDVTITAGPTREPIPPTGSGDVLLGGIVGMTALIAGFIIFFLTKGSFL